MTALRFTTPSGVEVPAVTVAQMREVDRIAVEETGPNLYQMMENAGRSLALTVVDLLGAAWPSTPILVLAGTGGNGGGGICAARHLANRGAEVTVVVADPERLAPVPAAQLRTYRHTTGRSATVDDLDGGIEAGLVVDAVVGYSLSGPPRGAVAAMIDWAGAGPAPVVSLDVPFGIDPDTGLAAGGGAHITAHRTLTLALPKIGLDSPAVGDLWLADIGIPAGVLRRAGIEMPPGVFGAGEVVRLHAG